MTKPELEEQLFEILNLGEPSSKTIELIINDVVKAVAINSYSDGYADCFQGKKPNREGRRGWLREPKEDES